MPVTDDLEIRSLLCHQHVPLALTCLGGLYRHARSPFGLVLHEDGTLTEDDRVVLAGALPGCRIVGRHELDEQVEDALSRYPACRALRCEHVMGLKLFDTVLDSRHGIYIYVDADVLFLRDWVGLFQLPDSAVNAIFMRDSEEGYCIGPLEYLRSVGVALPRKVNAGLCCIRRDSYDLDFIEWFLKRPMIAKNRRHWLVEQTAWAALAFRAGMAIWDSRFVCVPAACPEEASPLVAAHFAGSARRLLPAFAGLAVPLRGVTATDGRDVGGAPVVPAETLRWHHLASTEVLRKASGLRRRLGFGKV